jgi:hypothetical protein
MATDTQERMTGVVIFALDGKDYGCIRTPGVRDHFFHGDDIKAGPIGRHSAVSFIHQHEPAEKRDRARDVRVVEKPQ